MSEEKTATEQVAELESELAAVNEKREALRAEALELTRQRDALVNKAKAEALLSGMSDEQRAALAQVITVAPIASEEKFGGDQ